MVIDDWIAGHQGNRALQFNDSFIEPSQPVIGPAEAVHDVTVIRAQLHGLADHVKRRVQIHLHIDPRVSQIIENQGLIRMKLQCLMKVGFGFRPLLGPFIGNAARIIERPVHLRRLVKLIDRARIDFRGFIVPLTATKHVPKGDQCLDVVAILRQDFPECRFRTLCPVQPIQRNRCTQQGRLTIRCAVLHGFINIDRLFVAVIGLQHIAE